jgi:succinyl-diaminopimelate desuccinylase
VLRARMHIHGVAGHSGGSKAAPGAIAKAAALISELGSAQLPSPAGPHFPLPARLSAGGCTPAATSTPAKTPPRP